MLGNNGRQSSLVFWERGALKIAGRSAISSTPGGNLAISCFKRSSNNSIAKPAPRVFRTGPSAQSTSSLCRNSVRFFPVFGRSPLGIVDNATGHLGSGEAPPNDPWEASELDLGRVLPCLIPGGSTTAISNSQHATASLMLGVATAEGSCFPEERCASAACLVLSGEAHA